MNLPNKLTLLRILMIPVFLVVLLGGFLPHANYIAAAVFAAASLTDLLDGYIARSRNLITNFGKFADPLADKLLVAAAVIAFVEMGQLSAWVVIIIISREFIVTGVRLIAAEKQIVLAADFSGKIKTATQMAMVIYILLGFSFTGADVIKTALVIASVALSIYSACEYIVKNRKLFNEL